MAQARILQGDAASALKSLPSDSVALTVTSPPYFQHRDYGIAGQIGQEETLAAYLDRIETVLIELLRVTDDTGSCFFVVGDTYRNRNLLLVPHRIAILAGDIGWTIRNDIIWSKKDQPPESPPNRWRLGQSH